MGQQAEIPVSTRSSGEITIEIAKGLALILLAGIYLVYRLMNDWKVQFQVDQNFPALFCMLMLVGGGGYIIVRAVRGWENTSKLNQEGCNTSGSIENRGMIRTRHSRGSSTSYWVSYCFQANGQVYTLQQSVGKGKYQKWPPNTPINVRYLPENPNIARLID